MRSRRMQVDTGALVTVVQAQDAFPSDAGGYGSAGYGGAGTECISVGCRHTEALVTVVQAQDAFPSDAGGYGSIFNR